MIDYTMISSDEELVKICNKLKTKNQIAMDLEADSMHHFKEKVCLIQIADDTQNILIDPLSITDFSPLKLFCENPDITKVFHGADFDIRTLERDCNIRIHNLFDTEIACRFLGIQRRSLAALLKKHFNLCLDKRFQKTDWSKRPLSDEMIAYSLNDVLNLIELSRILKKKLEDCGRLAWAREEFQLQTLVKHDNNSSAPLFMKFKGAGKMSRRGLAVLEHLLHVRMDIARQKNLPLFKIMGAESISHMATRRPVTFAELKKSKALSPKQMGMYGEKCLKAILDGLAVPTEELPVYPRKKAPDVAPEIPGRIRALKEMREDMSKRTGMEPGFLINNAMITTIAMASPGSRQELLEIDGARKWQMDILGQEIINILNICA
ncbi:ribonuclease D [Desulfocicer vacuolatum DSM 3385]|uniref:Ribonuclease D n=1 Tax=Desulfocicer vacuolatum DSM 3385 TaxID=1121400 RepID=A0A1W2BUV4_9BACT|nr:ribonuclease D [Desulfocicer vacuolatum]SMC76689.1 ribonuclease D [Desulfocicer vacuolatum DSM 3385]